MKKLLILLTAFFALMAQEEEIDITVEENSDDFQVFVDWSGERFLFDRYCFNSFEHEDAIKIVTYSNEIYKIYSYFPVPENMPMIKKKIERRKGKKGRNGKGIRKRIDLFAGGMPGMMRPRGLHNQYVEKHFVDSDFIMTAENLKKYRIKEIKNSKIRKKDKEEIIKILKRKNYEREARRLSYLINLIKSHKSKGKVVKN
jgi:hypothetical protein